MKSLIFDKGNNSKKNLTSLNQTPFHFVGSLVPTHGVKMSGSKLLDVLSDIREATMVFPAPAKGQQPIARTMLTERTPEQEDLCELLELKRFLPGNTSTKKAS